MCDAGAARHKATLFTTFLPDWVSAGLSDHLSRNRQWSNYKVTNRCFKRQCMLRMRLTINWCTLFVIFLIKTVFFSFAIHSLYIFHNERKRHVKINVEVLDWEVFVKTVLFLLGLPWISTILIQYIMWNSMLRFPPNLTKICAPTWCGGGGVRTGNCCR